MNEERWRWVKGYEGLYMVSDHGRVMSMPKNGKDARCLKEGKTPKGYFQVTLYGHDGSSSRKSVHRLVARHFCGGYCDGLEVNHIDGDKGNNCATNLEWVTSSENELHKARVLGKGHAKPSRRLFTDEQVREIRTNGIGVRQTACMYGVSPNSIRQIRIKKSYKEVI